MVKAKSKNVGAATATGVGVGAAGVPIIAYGAQFIELKTGIPAMVTMPILGALGGLLTRWASKLNPNE